MRKLNFFDKTFSLQANAENTRFSGNKLDAISYFETMRLPNTTYVFQQQTKNFFENDHLGAVETVNSLPSKENIPSIRPK